MWKTCVVSFTVFVFALAGIAAGTAEDQIAGNPRNGRNIFVSKGCIRCHSVWGSGGKIGPDLTRIGMGKSFFQIAGSLWAHSPKMIELMEKQRLRFPTFTATEISDVITYLYYLNYFNEPGNAEAGRVVFSQKGCINCHAVGTLGRNVGPRLDTYQEYASPLFVAQAMWNHGPQMLAKMAQLGIVRPTFEGKEMADLLAFIRGRSPAEMPNQKFTVPGDPVIGRRTFTEKRCIACHSVEGKGGKIGPDLAARDLYHSVNTIAGAMWNHGPQMWRKMEAQGVGRPALAGQDIADIIAYLYFLRYTDKAGNTGAGKLLFTQKGCVNCHTLGEGSKVGPDLSKSKAIASPLELTVSMWNQAPGMGRVAEEKGLVWPKFGGDEMRDLVEYLKSFYK